MPVEPSVTAKRNSDPFIFDWVRNAEFAAVLSTYRDFVHLAERVGPPPKIVRIERCDFPAKLSNNSCGARHFGFMISWNQIEQCCS